MANSMVSFVEPYVGDMLFPKLTIEFAIDAFAYDTWQGDAMNHAASGSITPYRDTFPHIVAENHDQLAWYCYPEDGAFLVPTWDFFVSDDKNDPCNLIKPGETVTRVLHFSVDGGGIPFNDPRHAVITAAGMPDVLANRSSSLKISTWIDDIAIDDGSAYPADAAGAPLRNSNCSVFFVPEPTTASLLVLAGLTLLRRRRGAK